MENSVIMDNVTSQEIEMSDFEFRMVIMVGVTFGITFLVGFIGNLLVLLTILCLRKMQSSTNILILNLAIAELILIILCIPSTGMNYILR